MTKCHEENCNKIPSFNLQNETKGLYCSKHKLENMINIRSKRCIYENCDIIPNFNYNGKVRHYNWRICHYKGSHYNCNGNTNRCNYNTTILNEWQHN